jgi:hypothetical protein
MKKLTIILLFITSVFYSQTYDNSSRVRAGLEIDALPYLTGGYYFSAWGGYKNFRLRGVFTHFKSPSFVIPDGFEDQKSDAYTLLVDYFPSADKNEFEKWWIGAGLEYWKNSVQNSSDNATGNYDNLILTLGGGYVWKIWGNLYLNPWAAAHIALSGADEKKIGNNNFKPKGFLYEASLKLGWYF